MDSLRKISQIFGLHPLVGFGMVAVDLMLFGVESAILQVGWVVTIPVAIALAIPCALIQKFNNPDSGAFGGAVPGRCAWHPQNDRRRGRREPQIAPLLPLV
jgi:hypothetical protein